MDVSLTCKGDARTSNTVQEDRVLDDLYSLKFITKQNSSGVSRQRTKRSNLYQATDHLGTKRCLKLTAKFSSYTSSFGLYM